MDRDTKGRNKVSIKAFYENFRNRSHVFDLMVERSGDDPPESIPVIDQVFSSGIKFHNCGFSELKIGKVPHVTLSECDIYGELDSNITHGGTHNFVKCKIGSFKVACDNKDGKIQISETQINEILQINTQTVSVIIDTNSIINKITQIASSNIFKINQSTVDELELAFGSFYEFNNLTAKTLKIKNCQGTISIGQKTQILQELIFEGSNIVTIDSSTIEKFNIEETVCNRFESKSSIFNELSIKNVNDRSISFTDTVVKGLFTIYRSAIVKTAFNRFSFGTNAKLDIQQSSITDAKYYSIKWTRDFKIVETIDKGLSEDEKLKKLWDFREVYRQLKVVSLEFHNKLDAKKFQTNELRAYYRAQSIETFGTENWFIQILMAMGIILIIPVLPVIFLINSIHEFDSAHWIKKAITKVSNFSNWLLLVTNKIFSAFGESYGLPLGWLLSIHFLFFWSLFDALNLQFSTSPDWEVTKDAFGLFLNLLSPIHSLEIKNPIGETVYLTEYSIRDFFMRLTSGYFLYYFIQATRKYHFNV